MARKLRLEYAGACYHVLNRGGDYRRELFTGKGAAESFQACLLETAARCGWRVHAFVVMSNHYHLAVETPEPNLSEGRLQGTWATRFNRFRGESGRARPAWRERPCWRRRAGSRTRRAAEPGLGGGIGRLQIGPAERSHRTEFAFGEVGTGGGRSRGAKGIARGIVGRDVAGRGKSLGIALGKLPAQRSAAEKVLLAALMKTATSVSNGWLAGRLGGISSALCQESRHDPVFSRPPPAHPASQPSRSSTSPSSRRSTARSPRTRTSSGFCLSPCRQN